jgi:hypothetical protein
LLLAGRTETTNGLLDVRSVSAVGLAIVQMPRALQQSNQEKGSWLYLLKE